jgi:hypothetical protein
MKLRHQVLRVLPVIMLACSLLPGVARAQFSQQGPKLVGAGALGDAAQGYSVSLAGDGNTAIIGGPADNGDAGAAWVFTRSGEVWSQQAKLIGTGALGEAAQGISVSLSDDGNTAIVGGFGDGITGAAWVFTRSRGVWSQQGAKLVGTGAIGNAEQGNSVSLSGNGNTAIVGGVGDNNQAGAAWVFTRSGGVWSQQGAKLVGTDAIGPAQQGYSVSLSDDGNTAIVGAPGNNSFFGAAWVYTRSGGGVWSQQAELIGAGALVGGGQGFSVSLAGDGNTAILGGPGDGTAWVFTRSGEVWSQQAKLIGAGALGGASQGFSVSLSGDGNTAIIGGPADNGRVGAAWVFTRSGGVWSQQGAKLVGTDAIGNAEQGYSVSLSADGHTAIASGPSDNPTPTVGTVGAAWVYAQPLFAGTPGKANCYGQSVAALAQQYGGLNAAAAALGYSSVSALQNAIMAYCGG